MNQEINLKHLLNSIKKFKLEKEKLTSKRNLELNEIDAVDEQIGFIEG